MGMGGRLTLDGVKKMLMEIITTDPSLSIGVISMPPEGCYKVINLYVDKNGKLIAKWEDTPAP